MASFDSAVLASFVAQVRGIMFYDLAVSGASWGDSVHLVRAPYNRYDSNCLDVRCASGKPYLLGHLAAPAAALLFPLMRDVSVAVSGSVVQQNVEGRRST